MPHLKPPLFLLLALLTFAACAPRVAVRPIPPDTPPEKVLAMALAKDAGIKGVRASVKVTVREDGKPSRSFDAVLYAARPGRVRLTGLELMGFTAFDMVLTGGKFYFYQPSEGYLYTGPRTALRGFLEDRGVKADPEVIYRSLFFGGDGGGGGTSVRYFYDSTGSGCDIYAVSDQGGVLTPYMKAEFDAGLNLVRKVFYDGLARPYLYVRSEGIIEADGFDLPARLTAKDVKNGYTLTVAFEKYIVNPEGMDSDFTIQGGEFKGIRKVE